VESFLVLAQKMEKQNKLLERIRKSGFPPAAVIGAFSSFMTTGFRSQPESKEDPRPDPSLVQIESAQPQIAHSQGQRRFAIEYFKDLTIGGPASAHMFRRSLLGIAVDARDGIYVLGDGEVRIFKPNGDLMRGWKAPDQALCLTVSPDERVFIGSPGRVYIYEAAGKSTGGFAAGEAGHPAGVTAIKVFGKEILVADAAVRYIRRYNMDGVQLGEIGTQNKTRGFMLPNRSLDMDVDARGVVRATDSGRHRVTSWIIDGAPLGHFGKFGQANPEDFVGCCNPVNLAVAPDGKIVTAEKVIARVKVYDSDGKLLAMIGPEHFDPKCTNLHLSVDSKGRILVADPVRFEIKIFSPKLEPGGRETA
jgi:sugar lactone lactonase YvrE